MNICILYYIYVYIYILLGIEIFEPLVVYANNKRDQAYIQSNIHNNHNSSIQVDNSGNDNSSINNSEINRSTHNNTHSNSTHNKYNLHYIAASANAPNFKQIFTTINIHKICIQFPDPWYDKKCNRRIVNSSIIQQCHDLLKPNNGELYITTDIYELAIYMRDIVLNSGLFNYHILHYTHGSRYPWGHNSDFSLVDTSAVLKPLLDTTDDSHSKRLKTDHTSTNNTTTNDNTSNNTTIPAAAATTTSSTTNSETTAVAHIDIEHQWLRVRPYITGTERDQVCELKRDATIYRMLFSSV